MDQGVGRRIIALKQIIVDSFAMHNWEEIGLLTDSSDIIEGHYRLLRSFRFGDEDYPGNVLSVLKRIIERNPRLLEIMEQYVDEQFSEESEFISVELQQRKITFAPNVFQIPESEVEKDLVGVMMPFKKEFDPVFNAINKACDDAKLNCLRADDVWENSVIIQDVFNLIFRAHIIVVDFTGKNPNVMYETGIAHTLGKHVVPISQSYSDVPFDMAHHRILQYLPNSEGLENLTGDLSKRLQQLSHNDTTSTGPEIIFSEETDSSDDEIPF